MPNMASVAKSGFESVTALLNFRHDGNAVLAETKAFRLFRVFLAFKLALPFAFPDGFHEAIGIKTIALLVMVIAVGLPRFYIVGLIALLGLMANELMASLPFTINHGVLEFGIVLLMCLLPEEASSRITSAHLIKILMLSVWFYSGLHKLFDGYYLNGEFLALEALANNTTLGIHLNEILGFFGPHPTSSQLFECCVYGPLHFSSVQTAILLALSWGTILLELMLPVAMFIPRVRWVGLAGLFTAQFFIGYLSGEVDFAFTAFAILFLFVPRIARFTFPALAGLLVVVHPWF